MTDGAEDVTGASRRVSKRPTPLAFARSPIPIGGRSDPPQIMTTVLFALGNNLRVYVIFFECVNSQSEAEKITYGSKGGRGRSDTLNTVKTGQIEPDSLADERRVNGSRFPLENG